MDGNLTEQGAFMEWLLVKIRPLMDGNTTTTNKGANGPAMLKSDH